jgi:hypothetical protein
MIVNFVVAVVMVHTRAPFREALNPCGCLPAPSLLFHGAGVPSVDARLARRAATSRGPAPTLVRYGR